MVLGALMCTMSCKKETTEWWICYGATGPDDDEDGYYEFRDTQMCFENNGMYRKDCTDWGGTVEVVLETEDGIVLDAILQAEAEEGCANNGYATPCPDAYGYSKAWVQSEEDCPVYE